MNTYSLKRCMTFMMTCSQIQLYISLSIEVEVKRLLLCVGPRLKERVVTGRVVWEDGRSPTNTDISLYDGDRWFEVGP